LNYKKTLQIIYKIVILKKKGYFLPEKLADRVDLLISIFSD